jgi:hypothetical protein
VPRGPLGEKAQALLERRDRASLLPLEHTGELRGGLAPVLAEERVLLGKCRKKVPRATSAAAQISSMVTVSYTSNQVAP